MGVHRVWETLSPSRIKIQRSLRETHTIVQREIFYQPLERRDEVIGSTLLHDYGLSKYSHVKSIVTNNGRGVRSLRLFKVTSHTILRKTVLVRESLSVYDKYCKNDEGKGDEAVERW